jgi:hypothetical protein
VVQVSFYPAKLPMPNDYAGNASDTMMATFPAPTGIVVLAKNR